MNKTDIYRFDYSDRIVMVTGASGVLGSEIAKAFARCGAKVVLASRNLNTLEKLARRIEDCGGYAFACRLDVRNLKQMESVLEQVKKKWGLVDILVNNAGVQNKIFFLEESEEDFDMVLDINAKGVWICSKCVAKQLVDKGKPGVIVNMGSIASAVADSNQVSYTASKGAVNMLTKSIAISLAPYGIRVNAVAPQTILSDINRDYFETHPDQLEARLRKTPLGRLGNPSDVVGATLFLASDMSAFITATTLFVEGGRLSWSSGTGPGYGKKEP